MSDTFYMSASGQAYCLRGGEASQLSLELDGFDAFKPKSGKEGKCDESVVLVQNVAITKQAIAVPVVGVDKKRLLYSFGENFGTVRITATVLTGGTEYQATEPKGLLDTWEQESIIGKKEPVNLKWAGTEAKVYVKNITVVGADPQYGTIKVEIDAIIAPVTNKES